ncbi:MAG: hypothetical protein WCP20_15320 [Desulfuromonadales bacterium]
MKTSRTWNIGNMAGKMMIGLLLAAVIGALDAVPAVAKDKDNQKHMERHDNGRSVHRGPGYDHKGRRVYRSYGHNERYYDPPRAVYVPPPPPGISVFFPPILFRP